MLGQGWSMMSTVHVMFTAVLYIVLATTVTVSAQTYYLGTVLEYRQLHGMPRALG